MQNPLVTIIIPAFNQEHYIAQAIESALAQDYAHLEVVVSDDASTDGTPLIVERYMHDHRFRYVRHEQNRGRVGNYHEALYTLAGGTYVLNLDADDYLIDNTYIRRAVQLLETDAKMVAVFARKKVYSEKQNRYIEDRMNTGLPQVVEGNWLFLQYPRGYAIPHVTTLYRREDALKIGYYTKNIVSSDWESVLRLILNRRVGFVNSFVGVWRIHNENASRIPSVEEVMDNTEFIESSYQYAQQLGIASHAVLTAWRKKMLKRYYIKSILKMVLRAPEQNNALIERIREHDPSMWRSISTDIRYRGLMYTATQPRLFQWICRHFIQLESFTV